MADMQNCSLYSIGIIYVKKRNKMKTATSQYINISFIYMGAHSGVANTTHLINLGNFSIPW